MTDPATDPATHSGSAAWAQGRVPGIVHTSVSTWQPQPVPSASAARARVLDHVTHRVLACGDGRVRVAVDGRTAAGKSTFAHELAAHVSRAGRPVLRASLDDFKHPWRDRHRYDRESGPGYYRNAFDYPAARRLLLEPAGPGGSGICALASIDPLTHADHSAITVTAPAAAVLIVDGVFAFRAALNDLWDLRIWLDIPAGLSVQRGTHRDGATWAGTEAEAIHRDRYLPAEQLYLAEADPAGAAAIVIDNSTFSAPVILKG